MFYTWAPLDVLSGIVIHRWGIKKPSNKMESDSFKQVKRRHRILQPKEPQKTQNGMSIPSSNRYEVLGSDDLEAEGEGGGNAQEEEPKGDADPSKTQVNPDISDSRVKGNRRGPHPRNN
jgi:hypothetical protein